MHILITGGTGLIGQALTRTLRKDGHRVTILSRAPEYYPPDDPGVEVIGWDSQSTRGWGPYVEAADAIINLAGESLARGRWTSAKRREILNSRLQVGHAVTVGIATALHKPGVLIQASGIGYYGFSGDEPVTESTEAGDDFLATVAQEWEDSTATVEGLGVRRVVIRSGVVLSQRGGMLPRLASLFRAYLGGPQGSGAQYVPWIHLEDEVAAIRFLLEDETAVGPFNLCAPHPVTNAEFSQTLGAVLRRPVWLRAPEALLRFMLGRKASLLVEGQRAVPQRLLGLDFGFRYPELEPALRALLT
jgi:hypothetical protein